MVTLHMSEVFSSGNKTTSKHKNTNVDMHVTIVVEKQFFSMGKCIW